MLEILVPEETRNYCANPSVGVSSSGWQTVLGSTVSRILGRARFGRASLQVVCPGVAPKEGTYYSANIGQTAKPVCGSVYVRGQGQVFLSVRANDNSLEWVSKPVQLNDKWWQRLWVVGTLGTVSETDLRIQVLTYRNHPATFFVDGAQIELKGYPTTYCDGDQELELPPHEGNLYYEWVGQRHATQSFRSKSFRMGGRFSNLAQGLEVNLYPTEASGLGMPPIALGTQVYAGREQAVVQTSQALPRAVNLTFHARRTRTRDECNETLKDLQAARKALEDAMKPDLVYKPQPFLLRWNDGPCPMDLRALYESGLEWEGDLRDPTVNSFGVRLYCPNPYWEADSQDVTELDVDKTIVGGHAYLIARLTGQWQGFGSANFPVRVIKVHPNGDVYAGGDFTNIGGVACRHIARWDGTAWNILAGAGNDIDNGTVYAIAFDANGDVYIGGTFTTIDGVTMNRITRYAPATDTFNALGGASPGVNSDVNAIAVDRDGYVFVGGAFTAVTAGPTPAYRIVVYNGVVADDWTAIGTFDGLNADVEALEVDLDGKTIYVGGQFTNEFGVGGAAQLPYICKYTLADGFTAMGEYGLNAMCRTLKMGLDGRLWLGGDFTTAGFWNVGLVAYWDRREFYPLGGDGDGLTGTNLNVIEIDSLGQIHLGGDFLQATGDTLCAYFGIWNGSRFTHEDATFGSEVFAIASKFDKLFVGYQQI